MEFLEHEFGGDENPPRLYEERKGDGLDIIAIAKNDNPGLVLEHLKSLGVTYPNVMDASGVLQGDFRVTEVPHSIVIDKQGQLLRRANGLRRGRNLH